MLKLGAKLPLYAFKKLDKLVSDNGSADHEERGEPPVAFLDSLLLGEVSFRSLKADEGWIDHWLFRSSSSYRLLSVKGHVFCLCSGRIACREGCFAMMSLPAKPRSFPGSF